MTTRIPLTPAQRGIYFLHRLAPGSSVYNVPIALRVGGPLSVARLQLAVDSLVVRHEALRTTFTEADSRPAQVIHSPDDAPRVAVDHAPPMATIAEAAAEAERRAAVPFDLARGPLWRVLVIPAGADDHAVTLTFHHIVLDEASVAVLTRDLQTAYADPTALSPIDEYAECCHSDLSLDEAGLAYWRGQLEGAGTRVLPRELTSDGELFDGERLRFIVDPAIVELLPAFCRSHRVTPFMVFHAAFTALLNAWTGESDILIGTPVPGRADARFAETVGYFQNTVVLRTGVEPGDRFADLLARGRRTVLEALQHHRTPFEAVVEAVRPTRDATRNPLFQAALAYNRVRVEHGWRLDGLTVEPLAFQWPIAQFDLTLTLMHDGDAVLGEITYDTARFRGATMRGLAAAFTDLLGAAIADAGRSLAELPHPRRLAPATAAEPPSALPWGAPLPGPPSGGPLSGPPSGGSSEFDPWAIALCAMFSDVLGVDGVEPGDDFFELGGHSLLAGQLISRARAELDAGAELRDLFEAPTPAGLAARMRIAQVAAAPTRSVRPDRVPLSYAQRGLWFLHQLEGPSATYNVPLILRFPDPVDTTALSAAIDDLVVRHESLRTVVVRDDGEAYQVVRGPHEHGVGLRMVATTDADLDTAMRDAAQHAFDLATEAPLQATLFTTPTDQALLLLLHHIASDGWSLGPLGRDLGQAYAARCGGAPPDWEDLPAQYADFTLWQRNRIDSIAERQGAFWRTTLAGSPEELSLPADRPRPPVASYRGSTVAVDWDARLHADLVALARTTGTTLFMVLQAGLAALLSRLGAGTDIPLGAPVGERGDEVFRDLVGYFVNTVVLRTDVAGDPTFRALLQRVRRTDLAAFAHADLPFDLVVEAVNPQRTLARHPLFQVMLSLHRDPDIDAAPAGVTVSMGQVPTGVAKFDLSVNLVETPAGIRGIVEYAADRFDAETVDALATRWERLLRGAVADPERRVGDLDLLGPDELRWQLEAGTGEVREVPAISLPEQVARQAARTPDAVAVVRGTTSVTYAELRTRTRRLAHELRGRGVGAGAFVVVALPRSVDLLVTLLGVLAAGGAYVPVDPSLPPRRFAEIVSDVDPVLVVDSPLPSGNREGDGGRDGDADEAEIAMTDAAYAIFTSGSTGRPKGVVIEHGQLAHYLAYAAHTYPGLAGTVRVPTSASFDLTVTGLFGPLTVGGTVHLADLTEAGADETGPHQTGPHQPGSAGTGLTDAGRGGLAPLSFLKVVPSHLPVLTDLGIRPTGDLVLGGEALIGEALDAWRRLGPHTTIVNEYGPTETTVGCVAYAMRPGEQVPRGPVPIGRPVWNTRVYVLDPALRPVPVGVPGEIYVAGAQVGRCYLNRPALTAERFLPDVFGRGRMYRTGDIGRFERSGELVYLGRTDDQVKIRGLRVEPGEVAAALSTHPSVTDVAVVGDDARLVAYVVAEGVTDDALRAHAAERLPSYLVPDAFVRLPVLPLSPHGKLDRRALPRDTAARPTNRLPETATEAVLHRLFQGALEREDVGVDDNFFDLGGHSLLAVRLTALIGRELARPIPVGSLIAKPTVAALAAELDELNKPDERPARSTVRLRDGDRMTIALIHPVGGTLFCYQSLVRHLPDGVGAVGCERLPGRHPADSSLQEVADRYAAVLRSEVPEGPLVLAGWSVGGVLAHAVAAKLIAAGRPVTHVALLDSLAIRTADDRAEMRRSAAALAGLNRETPAFHELLSAYGVDVALLDEDDDLAAMLTDWAELLRLVAEHEPAPNPVPVTLFLAAQNPGDLPARIAASWEGLTDNLRVRPVSAHHLSILAPPALPVVAAEIGEVAAP